VRIYSNTDAFAIYDESTGNVMAPWLLRLAAVGETAAVFRSETSTNWNDSAVATALSIFDAWVSFLAFGGVAEKSVMDDDRFFCHHCCFWLPPPANPSPARARVAEQPVSLHRLSIACGAGRQPLPRPCALAAMAHRQ
jgi:hypothetical protein